MTKREKKELIDYIDKRLADVEKQFPKTEEELGSAMAYAEKSGALKAALTYIKIILS